MAGEFLNKFFGLVSPGLQAPKKITPKIHAQNRRHSSLIFACSNLTFFHANFLFTQNLKYNGNQIVLETPDMLGHHINHNKNTRVDIHDPQNVKQSLKHSKFPGLARGVNLQNLPGWMVLS